MESNVNNKDLNSMSAARKIEYAIQFFAGKLGLKSPVFATGTVKEVNEDDRTCTVEITMGDLPETFEGVNLMATNSDGFLRIPAIGSEVQIKMMPDNEAYVHLWSDLDAVIMWIDTENQFRFDTNGFVWNNGLNLGLVKITELVDKINRLEIAFNAHTHGGVTVGSGATAVPVTLILPITVITDLENEKIKH